MIRIRCVFLFDDLRIDFPHQFTCVQVGFTAKLSYYSNSKDCCTIMNALTRNANV